MKIVLLLVILATTWVSIEGALFFHTRPFPQTPKPTDGKVLKFLFTVVYLSLFYLGTDPKDVLDSQTMQLLKTQLFKMRILMRLKNMQNRKLRHKSAKPMIRIYSK